MREVVEKINLVIVAGPTAVGKTELAVRLAGRFDGEIVNADSMQLYRGMEIGTAKPSPEIRRMLPHHLIDILEPDQPFSASDFRQEAVKVIADIHRRGKRVFVAGGTGLYIKALLHGLVDSPGGDESLREELEEVARTRGNEALLRQLAEVDPESASRLHPNDRVRIIRALEVYRLSGAPISRFRKEHAFGGDYYRTIRFGIRVEREELYRRINRRVEQMMEDGLVEEVRALMAQGFNSGAKTMRAIGYKEIYAFLTGDCTLDEAVRLIKQNTRHYAKRQETWFKREPEIIWVEYPRDFDKICEDVMKFYG
ncbi:MAG: tRNA (adenosine(37)-N6)-dimethylallyltransferase MiaA [Geobacteraceae bacterium]